MTETTPKSIADGILIDFNEVVFGGTTGVPRATLSDAKSLSLLFDKVILSICEDKKGTNKENLNSLKIDFRNDCGRVPWFELSRPSNRILWLKQFFNVVSDELFGEISHTYSSLFPGIYAKRGAVTHILRLHDPFGSESDFFSQLLQGGVNKLNLARALRTRAFKSVLDKNVILVAQSESTRQKFLQTYSDSPKEIYVSWPSIGSVNSRERCQFTSNKDFILGVMSQRQRKNPIYVINEWARIFDLIKLDLVIVGSVRLGELSTKAQNLMNRGKLRFFSGVSNQALRTLQKSARLSIFASRGEGFGLPIAESLFYGVPVLYNRLEVFEEFGGNFLPRFDLDRPDSLAEILITILIDSYMLEDIRESVWRQGEMFTHEAASNRWDIILQRNRSN